jgi:hypothetical protein
MNVITEPLRLLLSNHFSLHEEHKEKQEVALIVLRELCFFAVRVRSTSSRKVRNCSNKNGGDDGKRL